MNKIIIVKSKFVFYRINKYSKLNIVAWKKNWTHRKEGKHQFKYGPNKIIARVN